jgi:mono/diheme cytochrome c family protein
MNLTVKLSLLTLALAGFSSAAWCDELTGQQVFDKYCVYCHGPDAEGAGTRQLAATRGEDKALLAERSDLAPEYVRYVVRNGLRAMPPFVPSELTEQQLEALTEFLSP